ncbi:S-layer homology domain-containing protein [Jeotgalibacillus sp. JSM ZJ347]|uniref:S-layer homology domain-containing protein n=1 Tax=Jeotgalibacillus sp. JSM ZJ347 TaxID=3342117 RepID=UPI0035A957DA
MRDIRQIIAVIAITCLTLGFSLPAFADAKFKDVESTHWAINEILYLSGEGVINGFNDGSFKPEADVTRGQAAIMLANSLNLSLRDRPDPGYTDVPLDKSVYRYIAAVADEGIVRAEREYKPNEPLTREDMAYMIYQAFNLSGNTAITYSDVQTNYWAQEYISVLSDQGIAAGFSNGSYQPLRTVTRAQFSAFMSRAMDDRYKVDWEPDPAPVAKGTVEIGMTEEEVLRIHNNPVDYVDLGRSSALYYQSSKFGYDTELVYIFENGILAYKMHDFMMGEIVYHKDEFLHQIYDLLKPQADLEFGESIYEVKAEEEYILYDVYWEGEKGSVILRIDNKDDSTYAALIYGKSHYNTASEKEDLVRKYTR